MTFKDDLQTKINTIFNTKMVTRSGTAVPNDTSVTLGSNGVEIDATVLYADLSESTKLVDTKYAWFAAQVYKSYLLSAAQIIKDEDGEVTAYDGDRVMGVFVGEYKNTHAVRAALRINTAVTRQINPVIARKYGANDYIVRHTVGVDTRYPSNPTTYPHSFNNASISSGASGSNSSIRLLGQVGSFSRVSASHSAGLRPLSFAVPSRV